MPLSESPQKTNRPVLKTRFVFMGRILPFPAVFTESEGAIKLPAPVISAVHNLVRRCTVRRKSVYDRSTCDANHRRFRRARRLAGVARRCRCPAGLGRAGREGSGNDSWALIASRLLCLIISREDYEVRYGRRLVVVGGGGRSTTVLGPTRLPATEICIWLPLSLIDVTFASGEFASHPGWLYDGFSPSRQQTPRRH